MHQQVAHEEAKGARGVAALGRHPLVFNKN